MANEFRINAKNYFLTYSNVAQQGWLTFTKEELMAHLLSLGARAVTVGKELHEDGSPHFHALVEYGNKKNVRNALFFDFNGVHPNVQAAKSVPASRTYCKKDGDFCQSEPDKQGPNHLEQCGRMEYGEWLQYGIDNNIGFGYAAAIWNHLHKKSKTIEEGEEFNGTMSRHLEEFQYDFTGRVKVLSLLGPTGCGKTTWAKKNAPKPALWVTHVDDLKGLEARHKSIIFDDVSFSHIPREAQIAITDSDDERSIHVRYGVARIPAGMPKIFTNNEPPFSRDPAVARRVRTVHIN